MKSGKEKKETFEPKKMAAENTKEFKWMGFKSHMMATMAQWREIDYLTDTIFKCVSFHTFLVIFILK